MKQLFEIQVRGKSGRTFGFNFTGDEKYLDEWLAEGFDIVPILNSIPLWAQQMGLTRIWCRVQDTWQSLRLW